ncbi:MAG TPA: adenosylcobinamide-GDP ribazoletransferase, partial [Acidimicrobiales bacterium]
MTGPRRAVAFLTPFGGAASPAPDAVMWFPMVGVVLGLGLGGLWWTADKAWSPLLVAALVVVADLALTGLLHADGLVDSADGLLPHLTRDRRLEVMALPDAGAFGVWVAAAVFALRWGALATMRPAPFLLAGLWCAS